MHVRTKTFVNYIKHRKTERVDQVNDICMTYWLTMTSLTRPTPVILRSGRLSYSKQSGFYIKKCEITLLKRNQQKICHSYWLIFALFAVKFNYIFIAKGQVGRKANIIIQMIVSVLKSLLIRVTLRLKLPIFTLE